jgi:hypothetical protein
MELIISAFRGRPELEELYFKYSNTYYLTNDYVLAAYYLRTFLLLLVARHSGKRQIF